MRIMVIFGTRPEAIKMCPLIKELKKHSQLETIVCLTGQHREMLQQVMQVFGIDADKNLDIMRQGQTLSDITRRVMSGIDEMIDKYHPALILVHGDTSTSFAAALSAFYHHIPIGHVEAGLRTHNMASPFPEEFNRQAVDLITKFFFAPTETAKGNLLKEGKPADDIYVTGNTAIDALRTTVSRHYRSEDLDWASDSRLILLTAHRRENLGEPMKHIFAAVNRITREYQDVKVIFPVHKNPAVREIAHRYFDANSKVRLIEPLDVTDFHNYMAKCFLVMSDSGGVQEEAPALGKPVLVLRDTTERPEGIEAGTLKLVGTEEEGIFEGVSRLLDDPTEYEKMSMAVNPYGDGHASERIVEVLINYAEGIDRSSVL